LLTTLLPGRPRAQIQSEFVIHGAAAGDQLGFAVTSAGDFNGDGYDDLIVGANANTEAGSGSGKVYVYFGGPLADSVPDWTAVGVPGELFGSELCGVGDINSDGYDDVLIGAPSNDTNGSAAGRAILFFGGNPPDTVSDWWVYGEHALDLFGTTLAGGRDLTGDDTTDFLVGAYRVDTLGFNNCGKVYLYAGGAAPTTTPYLTTIGATDGERYGFALATTDDFTGDAFSDYLIGSYSYDSGAGDTNAGRVLLMNGGPGILLVPVGELDGATPGELFGWALSAVGDVNGDGAGDFLVGAYGYPVGPTYDAGRAYLYFGGPAFDSTADFTVTSGGGKSERLGYGLGGGVDLDGNGHSDFAIGAPGDPSGTSKGHVYLYLGGAVPALDTTLAATANGTYFGRRVAMVRSFFGGESALVVGAWGDGSNAGAAYVYRYVGGSAPQERGDVNFDGSITAADIIYMVGFVFRGGPEPIGGTGIGDVNCDGTITAADIISLVNYVFKAGPLPCPL